MSRKSIINFAPVQPFFQPRRLSQKGIRGQYIRGREAASCQRLFSGLFQRGRRGAPSTAAAQRFAAGDLNARTMMEGADELGTVAGAFDRMAESVSTYQRHLKENEELLRKSEARFRNIVETTGDWVWEIDANMTYTYASPRVFDLLGYVPEELTRKSFMDFMPPGERRRFAEYFGPIAASKAPFFLFEHIELGKDGRPRIFESTGVPAMDDAGNLLGYRGIGRDVTERNPVDELLQKTLDEPEKLTGSTIGFYHFLEAGQNTLSLQNWSTNTLKTMCTAEGKGRHYNISGAGDGYKSLPHRKGMPEGHAPVERELVVPIFRGGGIAAIIGIGNKPQDYDESGIAIVSQIGGVSWDIVVAKRAEEALRKNNEILERIFAATYFCVVYLDREFNFLRVNAAYANACGHPLEYFQGKNHFQLYPHGENEAIFREVVSSGKPFTAAARPFVFSGHPEWGETYWDWTLYPLKDAGGAVEALLFVLLDVSERKKAEEAITLYQGRLEELVKKRTGELEAANLRLKELDRLKSMFIASMSHELRTPLNTIIGFVGIILQGMTGGISAEQRKQLSMVRDSSRHLLDLINDVIDISKIEAGKIDLSIERFDLASLVKKTAEPFAALAGAKGVKLSIAAPERLLIESDARRIRQVMVNLLGNAVKFTDGGEVSVSMAGEEGKADIVVTDTGMGISDGDMGKPFESFSRIAVDGRPKEGSGLGLYLTRKITNLLGGKITVESAVGMGSAFTVSLPLKYERR
ncbi:MAG: PAS domain-containing protein [Deltaproteobacteria bacterium]|nr:PAS domain-containing protein [Deltaproteobacteria bacterium]